MSEWISVKDRLPEFENSVLLYWEHSKHIEDGKIYPDEDQPEIWYHVLFDGQRLNVEPTHWQPLPEPPQ